MGLVRAENGGDVWLTPPYLHQPYGPFDLDPCASLTNIKVAELATAKTMWCLENGDDGLRDPWSDFGRVWLNPPFSAVRPFLERFVDHPAGGVALLPSNTDVAWFHELVLPVVQAGARIEWVRGRVKFYTVDGVQSKHAIGRPVFLLHWDGSDGR